MRLWHWWRSLSQNPVYLREKGHWGKPNPFFQTISRFSPFVVMGAIVLGFCGGFGNPALFSGDDVLLALWCFLCLPSILLNILSLAGVFLAPALTAPLISLEIDSGTWEILRLTPQSTQSIIGAKMLGALSRLRLLWPILFLLSVLQGLVITCSLTLSDTSLMLWGVPVGLATAVRPWVEIFFAAMVGMYASTRMRSATMALSLSYTLVVLLKLFNNTGLWMGVTAVALPSSEQLILPIGTIGPALIYGLAILALTIGLWRQAERLSYGS